MIPRNGPKVELLPPLKLFREDAEKLLSLFTHNCQHVRIGDEEHVYDSLDEMEERSPAQLRCLSIMGVVPHAELVVRGSYSVPLGVQRSTLWIAERNEKSELLFLAARDLLDKRKWKSMIALRRGIVLFGTAVLIACFFANAFMGPTHGAKSLEYNLVVLAGFALLVFGTLMQNRQPSFITLTARSKSESFWLRNRDRIILAAISVIVGGLGTLFIEWIKRAIFTK